MDYGKLEKNITDIIQEEQIKLGYRSESIRLYYPLQSLNRLLDSRCDIPQMTEKLQVFSNLVAKRLGKIEVSHIKERFCLTVPPKGVDYVHQHMDGTEFICDFIHTIEKHGCTIQEVLRQFHDHSQHVHVEKVTHGEFDYVVYFEDGKPDDYRYCLTDEGHHIIYHRFTKEDYEDYIF